MTQIWASDPQFNAITTLFVHENCVLPGYNAVSSGYFLPTFRDGVSIPSSRVSSLFSYHLLEGRKEKPGTFFLLPEITASLTSAMTFPFYYSSSISYVYFCSPSSHCQCSSVYHKQDVSDFFLTNNVERTALNNVSLLFRATNRSVSWFLQELISTDSYSLDSQLQAVPPPGLSHLAYRCLSFLIYYKARQHYVFRHPLTTLNPLSFT